MGDGCRQQLLFIIAAKECKWLLLTTHKNSSSPHPTVPSLIPYNVRFSHNTFVTDRQTTDRQTRETDDLTVGQNVKSRSTVWISRTFYTTWCVKRTSAWYSWLTAETRHWRQVTKNDIFAVKSYPPKEPFSENHISAHRGRCAPKFLHALENDKVSLAHFPPGTWFPLTIFFQRGVENWLKM